MNELTYSERLAEVERDCIKLLNREGYVCLAAMFEERPYSDEYRLEMCELVTKAFA